MRLRQDFTGLFINKYFKTSCAAFVASIGTGSLVERTSGLFINKYFKTSCAAFVTGIGPGSLVERNTYMVFLLG